MVEESKPLNWFPVALGVLCGLAVGIAIGLAVASTGGKSLADVATDVALTKRGKNSKPPVAGAEVEKTPTEEWETWNQLSRQFGPGSAFARFAETLEVAGFWNPNGYWSIAGNGLEARLILNDMAGGFVGHVLVVPQRDGIRLTSVELLFDSQKTAEVRLVNRDADSKIVVAAIAAAATMGLDKEEINRFVQILPRLPEMLPQRINEAAAWLVERMPERIRLQFAKRRDRLARGDETDDQIPVIGFLLSKNRVLEIRFGDTGTWATSVWTSQSEPANRWSLAITEANFSSPWPRLTLAEVDAFAKPRIP